MSTFVSTFCTKCDIIDSIKYAHGAERGSDPPGMLVFATAKKRVSYASSFSLSSPAICLLIFLL